jgi:hypothetical protein
VNFYVVSMAESIGAECRPGVNPRRSDDRRLNRRDIFKQNRAAALVRIVAARKLCYNL